ncbi:MAG TPA: sulfite exporter TauE/SafE family protein [Devosiaceae bacterium]|jgi:uncharacterized membrane protein YfcA
MTLPIAIAFGFIVFATSFLSGVFGMAGGMILVGTLLLILPVPTALTLQGVAQLASNGWRALLWRDHIKWSIALRYVAGLLVAAALFSLVRFVPDQGMVLIVMGVTPFFVLFLPERFVIQADHRWGAEICGFLCTAFQLFSGVSGSVLDIFFVRSRMDRKTVVATKAGCQVFTHLTKLLYFQSVVSGSGAEIHWSIYVMAVVLAIAGTTTSRFLLHRLSDNQFRFWTRRIVLAVSAVYFVQGLWTYVG